MEERKETPTPRPPTPIEREGEILSRARDGFLPFYTNAFDRVFISAVILIGIHLLWLRFIEPIPLPEGMITDFILQVFGEAKPPVVFATVISLVIGYFVVRRG